MKNTNRLTLIGLAIIPLLFLIGCGGSSISGTGGTKETSNEIFDDQGLSANFRNSVVQLPDNLLLSSISSSGKKSSKKSKSDGEESIAVSVYSTIFSYLRFSENIKESVVKTFIEIYDSGILRNLEVDVIYPTDGDDGFTGFKLEKTLPGFDWKVSLYNGNDSSPVTTFLFSRSENYLKGKILLGSVESKTYIVDDVSTTISENSTLEVSFEGSATKKSMSLKFVSDFDTLITFAKENWDKLSAAQKETLDLGKPKNLMLNVTFENDEYAISGTSYHPGWKTISELDNEDNIFGDNNQTYMFKAKSIVGDEKGVKMAVALPDNSLNDITTVYVDDSISNRFKSNFIDTVNKNLLRSFDEIDDTSTDDTNFDGDAAAEKIEGFNTIRWLMGDSRLPIQSLLSHGSIITQAEMDLATNFWQDGSLTTWNLETLAKVNTALGDIARSDESKLIIYNIIMAPTIISNFISQNIKVTYDDLEVLFAVESEDASAFKIAFDTFTRIVNPAFFTKEKGLLGTYDGTLFYEYNKSDQTLTEGDKPTHFDSMNAMDLESMESYTPVDVMELEIFIE
ncbi:MAG: hypothetical protein COA79_00075 [Planctomycetota bacterium]|nr:MAG: hypothetical protein COA79_00075 [Planctomycetota bacterium]